ncbi:hypothetical protein ES703_77770 [subsurface metagenome]
MDVNDFDSRGRLYYYYTVTELGTYQFRWNVPAQQELPENPDTPDGSWNSPISETEVVLRLEATSVADIVSTKIKAIVDSFDLFLLIFIFSFLIF